MKTALAVPVVLAATLVARAPARAQISTVGDRIFDLTSVHRIHVSISREEWNVLQTSSPRGGATDGRLGGSDYRNPEGRLIHVGSGFGGYFPWVRTDLRVEAAGQMSGQRLEFKDAGIRYKGNFSFTSSSAAAPLFANMKLKLDVHGARGSWDGERTFNLHAGVLDTSKMRDAIAYALFRAAGVPAPRTTYAELIFSVPGVYQNTSAGLFTVIEDVNRRFLERVLPPGTGLLMKPEGLRGGIQSQGDTWAQYIPRYRPERDATEHESVRVMGFARLVSQTDVALFRREISRFLDVEEFLRYLAVNAFIVNTDSYLSSGHNYYLYLDPSDDRFRFIPWDQDLAMGTRSVGSGLDLLRPYSGDHPLIYWLLDDPAVSARYRVILRELASSAFTKEKLGELVDALEKVPLPAGSTRGSSPRAFLENRVAYLQQIVSTWK